MEKVWEEKTFHGISLEAINEGALIVNAQGVVLLCNSRFGEMIGMPAERVVDTDWTRFFPNDECASLRRFLGKASQAGEKEGFTLQPEGSSGVAVELSARPLNLDEAGACLILVLNPRERGAYALCESEQRFNLLVEGLKEYALIMLDPSGRVTHWNIGAQRLNGYQPDEILGQSIAVLYPPEDRESGRPAQELGKAAAHGRCETEEWRVRKDGSRYWASVVITALRDPTGELLGYARLAHDMTEKKRVEETLRQSEMELKQAQRLSRMGSWEWLPEPDEAKWSDEMYRVLGRDPKEGPANYKILMTLLTPESRERLEGLMKKALLEGTPFEMDLQLASRDAPRWITVRVEPAERDPSGQVVKLRGTAQDITERRLGQELRAGENRILEMIANRAPLPAILENLTQLIEGQSSGMLCSVLLLDEDGEHLRPIAGPSLPEPYNRATDGLCIGPKSGSCGTAAYWKKPVVVEDILADPLWADYREVVAPYNFRACWSTPIMSHLGKVLGTFAMYYRQPKTPGPAEQRLIETATNIAKIAIEHQQADEALRQSEERFRTAFAGAAVGMAIVDLKGRFREINPAYSRITGYATGELIGQEIARVTHPEDLPMTWELVDKLLAREIPNFVVQKRYVAKGDGVVWVQNSVSLLSDAEGRPVVMLLITEDITQRKQAEDQLRRSEERFRTMAETVPGFIFTSRPDGWNDYCNRSFYEYVGLPAGSMTGNAWQQLLHPQDREGVAAQWQECLKTGEPFDRQQRLRGADGNYRWFLVRARPIHDLKGNIVQWLGTATDIEEQKRAEEILEERVARRTAKLQETVGELEQYSYSITHDLRAPLRAIQGFTRLLEEEGVGQISEVTRDYLQRVMASTKRMDNLIRDSLNYGKILQTEMKLDAVEVPPVVREIIQAYPALQSPNADVSMEGDFPLILGNDAALSQCVSNLLLNAVKFVAPGTHPRVRMWAETRGDWVRFWIEDNGIGIASELQEQIFGMFQQLSKAYEGTGIGLAIVRKAAERMGGKVGVESEPGAGSRFWIELRRAKQE